MRRKQDAGRKRLNEDVMKRYDDWILDRLLDKYEHSLLFYGKNKVNISVAINFTKTFIPEYFNESSVAYTDIHTQLEDLEGEGLIRLCWKNGKRGGVIEKAVLDSGRLDEAYARVGRRKKSDKANEILGIIEEYTAGNGKAPASEKGETEGREKAEGREEAEGNGEAAESEEKMHNVQAEAECAGGILGNFLEFVRTRLENGESVARYIDMDDAAAFRRLCEGLSAVINNKSESYIREFSVQVFNDSKLFEKIAGKATDILRIFSDDSQGLKELNDEQILEEFNIYRNPTYVCIKGSGTLDIGGNRIVLERLKDGIGISSDDLDRVKICPESRISVGTVVTVENLTSFHRFCQERAMVIYLAGYHNEVKRKLLKEIYTVIPDVPYRHFGDIDCGGFKIWENLRERTEIPFEPMRMGIAELKAYGAFGRQLSETDRKEIRKMLLCPAYAEAVPVLGFMLSHNLKLEQECIV